MLRNIFGIFITIVIAGFLVYTTLSWSFGWQEPIIDSTSEIIRFSSLEYSDTLVYTPITDDLPSGDIPVYAEFWRLASALLLPSSGFQSLSHDLVKMSPHSITLKNLRGIFSWYDPFVNYSLIDQMNHFRIDQITSGSFYIWREADNTISLYSIDAVLDLSFLYNSSVMTKMIVFPGMYVRFDPKYNSALQGADLFRIMQTLKGTEWVVSTGIEFVDPRMNIDANTDTFFMYRLPYETRTLFDLLHRIFSDRVKTIDLLSQYARINTAGFVGGWDARAIHNPTKNTYRLLGQLQAIFSQAVSAEMSSDEFRSRIEAVMNESRSLMPGNEVQELIEQFLIDGRFALFLDIKNSQYQDIYHIAAELVGIAPTTGKGRLFQSLSNIFSKNLLESTNGQNGNIDTYILAVTELKNTLTLGEMDTNDYFDLSLYAYLIFEKMTDGTRVNRQVLETDTLYQLYVTMFQATQKYVTGITDTVLASTAQKSLIISFYEPLMSILVRSLYESYTMNSNGVLFIRNNFLERDTPGFALSFASNLQSVESVVRGVYDRSLASLQVWGNDLSIRESLYKYIIFLDAFNTMISRGNYKAYRANPYQSEGSGSVLPKYNTQTREVVRQRSDVAQAIPQNSWLPQPITLLARVLSIETIAQDNVRAVGNDFQIRINNSSATIDFVYSPHAGTVSGILFQTTDFSAISVSDTLSLGDFRVFLTQIPEYSRRVKKFFTTYSIQTTVNPILLIKQGHIRIGDKSYILEN